MLNKPVNMGRVENQGSVMEGESGLQKRGFLAIMSPRKVLFMGGALIALTGETHQKCIGIGITGSGSKASR